MKFNEICTLLGGAGITNPKNEAVILISHFCGLSPAEILANRDKFYAEPLLLDAINKRLSHYPLQYIIGEWSFYKETYHINPHCLIPRSDTELLVQKAIEYLPQSSHFLDLCTGSGCVAISVLSQRQGCFATAVELFPDTLALATENAEQNNVFNRISFFCGDVLKGELPENKKQYDAILSNPPYIKTEDISSLEKELFFEPLAALDGGVDGLVFYRAILNNYLSSLKEKGFLLFEHGVTQGTDIINIAKKHSLVGEQFYDLSGNDRVCLLTKKQL